MTYNRKSETFEEIDLYASPRWITMWVARITRDREFVYSSVSFDFETNKISLITSNSIQEYKDIHKDKFVEFIHELVESVYTE